MKINNARIILLENLRQSCIYLTTSEKTLDTYWNYMTKFSDDCADVNNLVFNEDCATAVMDSLKIDAGEINNCMENEIKSKKLFKLH